MQRKLKIKDKPLLHSYSYHMNTCSICEGHIDEHGKVADIDILEGDTSCGWEISAKTSKVTIDQGNVSITNYKYDEDMGCVLTKEAGNDKEWTIRINDMAYGYSWSNISLVYGDQKVYFDGQEKKGIEIGYYAREGVLTSEDNKSYEVYQKTRNIYPIYFRIRLKENTVSVYSSLDGENWVEQRSYERQKYEKGKNYINISVHINKHQWYEWLYSNFIMLIANVKDTLPIDHVAGLRKSYKYYNLNMFLDFARLSAKAVEEIAELKKCLKSFINENYYIELPLNEKYVSGSNSHKYGIDRPHVNLLYGYDDESRCFYVRGIDINGHVYDGTICEDDIPKAFRETREHDEIVLHQYNPQPGVYEIDIPVMIKWYENYLKGEIGLDDCKFLLQMETFTYGVKVYDDLLQDGNVVLYDRRVGYILFEHHKIMRERIEFLRYRGFLSKDGDDGLDLAASKLVEKAEKVVNLVLKFQMLNSNGESERALQNKDRILQIISAMKNDEIALIEQFIDALRGDKTV